VSTPAQVTLTRTNTADVGQRQVIVSIDDGRKTNLMFGESLTLEVPPGDHELKCNNTLVWKKIKFTAEPGEQIRFQITNRTSKLTLGFLSLIGVAPLYLTVERT